MEVAADGITVEAWGSAAPTPAMSGQLLVLVLMLVLVLILALVLREPAELTELMELVDDKLGTDGRGKR